MGLSFLPCNVQIIIVPPPWAVVRICQVPSPGVDAGEGTGDDDDDSRNCKYLLSTHYVPGPSIWMVSQQYHGLGTCYFCRHFTDKRIEP